MDDPTKPECSMWKVCEAMSSDDRHRKCACRAMLDRKADREPKVRWELNRDDKRFLHALRINEL